MSAKTREDLLRSAKKCDARGCGSPAKATDRLGARFCDGHAYLANRHLEKVSP